MLAMAVVNHKMISDGAGGSERIEEEEDILTRLRYLRRTLQECHKRMSIVDQKLEGSQLSVVNCTKSNHSFVSKEALNGTSMHTNKNCQSYVHTNGIYSHEESSINQKTGDNIFVEAHTSLDFGPILGGYMSYGSPEPFSGNEMQYGKERDYIMHLAQKHANELYDMYCSKSHVNTDLEKKNNATEKNDHVKKRVRWQDEESTSRSLETIESANQNGNDLYENETIEFQGDECVDYNNTSETQHYPTLKYIDDMKINEYTEAGETELSEIDRRNNYNDVYSEEDPPETEWVKRLPDNTMKTNSPQEVYSELNRQMESDQIIEKSNTKEPTENYSHEESSNTFDCSSFQSQDGDVPLPSHLHDISRPWFRKAQHLENNVNNNSQPKRRKHALIRSRKGDKDNLDKLESINSETHAPHNSQNYGVLKMLHFVEEPESIDKKKKYSDSDDIITEDVSSLEIVPEETECENSVSNNISSNAELLSEIYGPHSQNTENICDSRHGKTISGVPEGLPNIDNKLHTIEKSLKNATKYFVAICKALKHIGVTGDDYEHSEPFSDLEFFEYNSLLEDEKISEDVILPLANNAKNVTGMNNFRKNVSLQNTNTPTKEADNSLKHYRLGKAEIGYATNSTGIYDKSTKC
ncbi:hypothetical protein SK128_007232 [Halocaridina rubra]|uniref:Uncharacterized protein n=1 Tax=Halocaridina rubra TaxID=373956 RepID=A0AAN9AHR9_HALRR